MTYTNDAWGGAPQSYPSGGYNAICFADSQQGWAVGDSGIIIHTDNGWVWTEQTNPDTQRNILLDVYFLNLNEGWIVGTRGIILHTINGGATWDIEADGLTNRFLTSVFPVDNRTVYVCGNAGTLLKYQRLETASQRPGIIGFKKGGEDHVIIVWTGAEENVTIEFSPSLSSSAWQAIAGPLSGSRWSGPMPPGANAGFYQLKVD